MSIIAAQEANKYFNVIVMLQYKEMGIGLSRTLLSARTILMGCAYLCSSY